MIDSEETSVDWIYDGLAETYGYDTSANVTARLKHNLMQRYIFRNADVLDVGCANGIHMHLLSGRCHSISGIDINEKMLDLARKKLAQSGGGNVRLFRQSAACMEFPDRSFDLAYSYSTLLLVPEIDCALAEIARVLRPGGIAIFDITGRYNLSRLHWGRYYKSVGHFGVHSFRYGEIVGRLADLGFEVLERHALGFCDQWKYIPLLNRFSVLERFFHGPGESDRDYRISNTHLLFPFANRWFIICRKSGRAP